MNPLISERKRNNTSRSIREFHLFAGIGGGIYGGELLGHECCGGVEIDKFCQDVLIQRQKDGWMNEFSIYGDICNLKGDDFKEKFDVLCGGFPCQAFSTAAHGKNISEKDLWQEMLRFVKESDAPIVFGENVVLRAIDKASDDLRNLGYRVERCRLSCSDLGADHQRNRFWLLAVKDYNKFELLKKHILSLKKLTGNCWTQSFCDFAATSRNNEQSRRAQLKGIGNAQSPFVAAVAFRILVRRHLNKMPVSDVQCSQDEIRNVFEVKKTWIQTTYDNIGFIHTPTTMANYAAPSMMKHQGCRNFVKVFKTPNSDNAEYLMGFPAGASSLDPQKTEYIHSWKNL